LCEQSGVKQSAKIADRKRICQVKITVI
jgi:hypothetical protein